MAKTYTENARAWTDEEIDFLKENYGVISNEEIGKAINRSARAINTYCFKHNIKHPSRWSEEDKQFLADNYRKMSLEEISERLGRTEASVKTYAHKHNLKSSLFWTKEEEDFLEENYGEMTLKTISKKLGKSYKAVQQKVFRMGLGAFYEQSDSVTITEASRIIGRSPKTIREWIERGYLKSRRISRYRMIKIEELFRFMKKNPKRWTPSKCDTNLLEYYPWFHKRLLEERKKKDEKRGFVG